MNNKKISIIILSALIVSTAAGIFSLGATVVSNLAAYVINDNSYFTYEDQSGNIFKCYSIDGQNSKVAIAWGMDPSSAPDNLIVPGTVTHGGDEYTVVAVAKAGFRYCGFEHVSLPNSIEEIREEAFGYCESLERFVLPYNVTEIAPSTFIDCRAMEYFFYSNSDGSTYLLTNDKVTSIGDHAFNSCVSLVNFNCSTALTYFGESCFQNCTTLSNFYLPSKTGTGNNINLITIKSYAFAHCTNLKWVYFEENLNEVEPYAFVDCDSDLKLHFGYYSVPFTPDNKYETNWRKKIIQGNNSDKIPIENDHIVILQSNDYPGLRYTIESADIMLDCQNQDSENNATKTICLAEGGNNNKYAVIYKWDPPTETVANYYNPTTKALTIPGAVTFDNVEYPLKVIKKETFANQGEYISSVKFSDGLVQICRRAFYKCTAIASLDFSECTTLKEISNGIFADRNAENTFMTNVHALSLPNSLEYLGKYAFFNFNYVESLSFKANDPDAPSQLKVMGGYCFSNIGAIYGEAKFDVALPCSLSDAAAMEAKINKQESSNYNNSNWAAVGPYAFGSRTGSKSTDAGRTAVRVVTMDDPTPEQSASNTYTCSISPNAFNRSWFMTKFVASENLCLVGCDAFKNCEQLREIFLTTRKAAAFVTRTGRQYPWGAFKTENNDEIGLKPETSILGASSTVKKDLVIYVDGPAPGSIENPTYPESKVNGVEVNKWNTDTAAASTSYNVPAGLEIKQTRTGIPTFYNVDFSNTIYWKPTAKVNNQQRAASFLDDEHLPAYVNEYNDGVIVFVKQNDKYTVSKYYCDTSHQPYNDEVDLTNVVFNNFNQDSNDDIDISSNLTSIGMCAFAVSSGASQKPGLYFKLPASIVEIGERAFFRYAGNGANDVTNNGVRVVTYVSGNTVQVPNNISYSTSLKPGYCMLPAGLTSIGLDAFYNNYFASVTLGGSITHFGAGAFYTGAKLEKISNIDNQATGTRSALATITMTTNSDFETVNNGVYYIGNAAKKTLVYQAQGTTGTLNIASNTKAIGMYACSNTSYTTINLNAELTHIYGMAFQNNVSLTTVTGGAGVKYISAMAPDDEIWDSSLPFENIDYAMILNDQNRKINSRNSAFKSCRNLVTVNFKTMTSLVKIGSSAFRDCINLEEMTGGDTYEYYTFNGSTETQTENTHSGVLDLSNCSNLRVIHSGAFVNCPKIKFLHLPATNGQIYVSQVGEGTGTNQAVAVGNAIINDKNNVRVLIGDKINQAGRGFDTSFSNANAHYLDSAFGTQANLISTVTNHNTVYYYVESVADIIGGGTTGLTSGDQKANYWTIRDGKYILIEGTYTVTEGGLTYTYSNAKRYFELHP